MDATVHVPFCISLRQRSNHAAKLRDEAGIPPRALSLSLQPHSPRLDNANGNFNYGSTAMDVLPAKVDAFATFVPHTLQRSESLSNDQTNLTKIVPVSASQSMVISCDDSKSFLFKSITPYKQQATAAPKMLSELIQPSVLPSSYSVNGSLASSQALSLSHCSFSVPTTNTTTGILSHGPCCDRATNDSFYKSRDPILVKEVLQEGHCDNASRKLRLETAEGPSPGLLSTYGRTGWHDGSRQSTLPYSGHGASRFYTRPAPSLPLLPLGQTYGRGAPRRLMLNSFPESHCCEAESFGESACNILNRFKNSNEGNVSSVTTLSIMQSMYSGANITYTAAGTAPPPKTFRDNPDQVVICSSTTSDRTLTYPYPSKSTYTYAECNSNHRRASPKEGICKPSMHSSSKYSKKMYSTNLARSPTIAVSSSLKKGSSQSTRNGQTSSVEEHQQNFGEDKNIGRPAASLSTFPKFYFLSLQESRDHRDLKSLT